VGTKGRRSRWREMGWFSGLGVLGRPVESVGSSWSVREARRGEARRKSGEWESVLILIEGVGAAKGEWRSQLEQKEGERESVA
jgi:hypothetical protein